MKTLSIKVPIWNPVPSVGISEKYKDDMEIIIEYSKLNGEKMYPERYYISWNRLQNYPLKQFKANMPKVRIVPIGMLEVL